MAVNNSLEKFNPDEHRENIYDLFCEFIDSFHYEYDAIAKDPPAGTVEAQAAWIEQNKRKLFLGRFASRTLQKDYEDVVELDKRGTITFTEMIDLLKARYMPTRNQTLANYEFHNVTATT